MRVIILFFLFAICGFTNANPVIHNGKCNNNSYLSTLDKVFKGDNIRLNYEYCEYPRNNSSFFEGFQSIKFEINGQIYIYSDNINGDGYFGGEMFYSELGVFGIVERFTGNLPITITYLSFLDNNLTLLGKITFEQEMGNIIGNPIIDSENNNTDVFIKKILLSNKEYFLGEGTLNFYEAMLLVLDGDLKKNLSIEEFNQLSLKLLDFPDLINFFRQNIFFKESSLCKSEENIFEMIAFGCRIKNKVLSICFSYFQPEQLIYRYGDKNKIELQLYQGINENEILTNIFKFPKGIWQYEVYTEPYRSGILIKKDEKDISFLKCDDDIIEPVILPSFFK